MQKLEDFNHYIVETCRNITKASMALVVEITCSF